jgi:hypothetical protein
VEVVLIAFCIGPQWSLVEVVMIAFRIGHRMEAVEMIVFCLGLHLQVLKQYQVAVGLCTCMENILATIGLTSTVDIKETLGLLLSMVNIVATVGLLECMEIYLHELGLHR